MAAKSERDESAPDAGVARRLVTDLATLVRHEVELAKTELSEKIKAAGIGVSVLSASALSGLLALACLTALVVELLSLAMAGWIALSIVTVFWAAVTAALAIYGKTKVQDAVPLLPEQTIADLKEDIAQARGGTRP